MAINFKIGNPVQRVSAENLIKGFGLPIVKRAFINAGTIKEDRPDAVSLFGTPLYGTVFLESPAYFNYEYDDFLQEYKAVAVIHPENNKQIGDKYGCFIEGAIIEISQNRNIVTTTISGMDGTVKEFINNGDYNVSIRGYFASKDPDVYPAVDVRTLSNYLKTPVALKVTNIFLNDYFGITDIVPVSYSFHQQEGVRNVQYFEIQCLSDIAFEIKENAVNA